MSLTFWLLHASVLNTQGCLASALRVLSVLPTTALQAAKEASISGGVMSVSSQFVVNSIRI